EVDEAHFAYSFKYLKNKAVKELNGDQFLKMCLAEEEGLLSIDICIDLIGVKGDAQMIMEDIKRTISELEQESSLPAVGVELVDNELATLYMNSKKSEDPLIEYAQVCSTDEDILCLKLHPLQEHVVKEDLLNALYCEFINRVNEVWNHFDSGSCPGQAIGVRSRLDNGVQGFIPTKFLSDKVVKHPEERVKVNLCLIDVLHIISTTSPDDSFNLCDFYLIFFLVTCLTFDCPYSISPKVGMTVHCRIMKIDIEKFSVDLTCRTSDLMDKNNEWKLPKDSYYDFDTEAEDQKQEEELKKKQQRTR
ncbi:hypothetical protein XENOCAPTIV_014711, partial [Xenoophorus captivus]